MTNANRPAAESEVADGAILDVRADVVIIEGSTMTTTARASANGPRAPSPEDVDHGPGLAGRARLLPWRSLLTAAGELVAVGLVAPILAYLCLRLWRLPFGLSITYRGDELAGLTHVKGVDQTGWWFTNPMLGAPFGMEHYDFPHGGESIQVAMVRALGLFSDSPAAIMNAYFLLTFSLVAVSAMVVLRHLRFSLLLAAEIALLYSLLPFHFARHVGHIYRSGYFAAPLGALVLLWLAGYDGGYWHRTDDGERLRLRRDRLAITGVAVVLIAGTDVVAAAFAPAVAGVVGLLALLRSRDWRTLAACMTFGVATIFTVAVFNAPTLAYRQANGANPETVQRQLSEQEAFGLKLSRVILPSSVHPIDEFAELGRLPLDSRIRSENGQALGVLGVFGLIGGVAAALPLSGGGRRGGGRSDRAAAGDGEGTPSTQSNDARPGARSDHQDDARPERRQLAQVSGLLMILIIVIAVPSGLSYLTSVAGLEEIRTWNRIVVYLGFFALLCAAIGLEWVASGARRRGVPSIAIGAGLLVVGGLAVFDQAPGGTFPFEENIESWNQDAHFFHLVEESLAGEGAVDPMVFQLPVVDYPEPGRDDNILYEHFRGYLHTDNVAWSHGAMRGRPASAWQDQLELLPSAVALDGLAAAGFDGVYVDNLGYLDGGAHVRSLIPDAVTVADDRHFYYSLAARRAALEAEFTPAELDALAEEILYPVTPSLGDGFWVDTTATTNGVYVQATGDFRVESALDVSRPVTIGLSVLTDAGGGHRVELLDAEGRVLVSGVTGQDRRVDLEVLLDVPPEGLDLRLSTDSTEYSAAGDPRIIHMEMARLVTAGQAIGDRIAQSDEAGLASFN